MFIPHQLDLKNGNETLTSCISVEPTRSGRFVVRVFNGRKFPSNYFGTKSSNAGNIDTSLHDTEQQADNRAGVLVRESLDQGYALVESAK
jgi:hypothetical protein